MDIQIKKLYNVFPIPKAWDLGQSTTKNGSNENLNYGKLPVIIQNQDNWYDISDIRSVQ